MIIINNNNNNRANIINPIPLSPCPRPTWSSIHKPKPKPKTKHKIRPGLQLKSEPKVFMGKPNTNQPKTCLHHKIGPNTPTQAQAQTSSSPQLLLPPGSRHPRELLPPATPGDLTAVANDWRGCPPSRSNAGRAACRRRGGSARDLKARLLLLGWRRHLELVVEPRAADEGAGGDEDYESGGGWDGEGKNHRMPFRIGIDLAGPATLEKRCMARRRKRKGKRKRKKTREERWWHAWHGKWVYVSKDDTGGNGDG